MCLPQRSQENSLHRAKKSERAMGGSRGAENGRLEMSEAREERRARPENTREGERKEKVGY